MLINFNKRSSSSSSPHVNSKYIESSFIGLNGNNSINATNDDDTTITANDDTIQLDEQQDDCVYQITIKKVYNKNLQDNNEQTSKQSNKTANLYGTYRPLSNTFFSYVDHVEKSSKQQQQQHSALAPKDGLIYTRVKTKQLKYATLPKFVFHLTNEETGQLEFSLMNIFLVTYRTFTDTSTALKLIRARYEQILPASLEMTEDVRIEHLKSIQQLLCIWLENYVEDFNEPNEYKNLNLLNKFVKKHMPNSELSQRIQRKYEQFESMANSSQVSSNSTASSHLLSIKVSNSSNSSSSGAVLTNGAATQTNEQIMHSSFASTSQFSVSPASTSSTQSSTSRPLSTQHYHHNTTNHRRSCSNFLPNNSSSETQHLSNLPQLGNNMSHSKSQSNLLSMLNNANGSLNAANNGITKSPILSLFSNGLVQTKKSNSMSIMVNAMNEENLMESTFMQIDSAYIAEQLTYIDKCLFPKVCAHLCLGGVWSTRYKKTTTNNTPKNAEIDARHRGTSSPTTLSVSSTNSTPILSDKFVTIGAFIDQFNCVSFVVQATILENVELKASDRAKIIKKWIEVAQACLAYKNFSSLNAIVQGLNTQCVSRLERTWAEISSEYKAQFDELTEMFSEDHNQKVFRSILAKDLEEYSQMFDINDISNPLDLNNNNLKTHFNLINYHNKYADLNINSAINATLGRKYKENMKKQFKNQFREPLGTIPFLGTFLKDLEYINAQNPSKMDKGFINIMQKKKEYEIIAQIKLLQKASQLYNMKCNPDFNVWLHKQTVYSEEQNYKLSYLIEPRGETDGSNPNNSANRKTKINTILISESTDSLVNTVFSTNKTPLANKKQFSQFNEHSRHNSYGGSNGFIDNSNRNSTHSKSNSNDLSNSNSLFSSPNDTNNTINTGYSSDRKSIANSTDGQFSIKSSKASINNNESNNMVVKVIIEFTNPNEALKKNEKIVANTVIYKRIFIKDSDRTKDVKRAILEKFFLDPDTCDKYTLVQVFSNLNQKELVIGDNCNVFYAAKNVSDMQFVLRRRSTNGINGNEVNVLNNNSNIQNNLTNKSVNSNGFKSPMLHPTNKFTKNLTALSSKNGCNGVIAFDELPPHYPNFNKPYN